MHPLELQGLDGYYVSFGIPGTRKLLYMCLLELRRGYVLRNIPKTFLCFNTWGTNFGKVLYSHLI